METLCLNERTINIGFSVSGEIMNAILRIGGVRKVERGCRNCEIVVYKTSEADWATVEAQIDSILKGGRR